MTSRVFIATFKHETNTFSSLPTDIAAYQSRELYFDDDVIARMQGTKTETAGFLDAAERYGWEITPCIEANATPSGKVTQEAYETISERILQGVANHGPFDAILLSLHGAMVAEHEDDGEGRLLERIRSAVGDDVPIGVTLDLHANVTDRMALHATAMVSYRTYPHIDGYEIAVQVADIIAQTLQGTIKPRCVVARGAMLDGVDHGRTTSPGPMTEVLASADRLLQQEGIVASSINAGFPWVDIHDTGPSALLVYDAMCTRDAPVKEYADSLVEQIWESRERLTIDVRPIDDAIKTALASKDQRPVVLADFGDNPGGGGYGDATRLLQAMIDSELTSAAFATLYDPQAVAACHQAGVGANVSLELGNKIDSSRMGAPISVTGEVLRFTDGSMVMDGPMNAGVSVALGKTCVLRVGGVDIVIVSARSQAYDQQHFKHAGINPTDYRTLAVKSAHHFRAAYAPIASDIIVVDGGGGLTSCNYAELHYTKVRRPVYPLDVVTQP